MQARQNKTADFRKWPLLVVLAGLSAVSTAQSTVATSISVSSADHAADEQEIVQLNNEWLKAYDGGVVAMLDRIEDETFVVSGDFGLVTKKQQLEEVRQRSGKATTVNRTIENQRVRFYGDVALVTEFDRESGADGTHRFQSTEVWVRRDGGWKVAHLHFSEMTK